MKFKNTGELRGFLLKKKEKKENTFSEIDKIHEKIQKIKGNIEGIVCTISGKKKIIDFLPENDTKYLPLILSDISSLKKELCFFLDEYSKNYEKYNELCKNYNVENYLCKNPLELVAIFSRKY